MAGMDRKFVEALDKCMELLVKTLPSILEMVLVKMNTDFLEHQQEVIRAQNSSVRMVVEFVKALKTMQNELFLKFLNVLDQLNYQHLSNEIRRVADLELTVVPPPQSSK